MVDGSHPLGREVERLDHLGGHEPRGVWTQAPSATARRISAGNRRVEASHSSGYRTMVRSCTVTTRAARRAGGTTKLVPCTTWWVPTNHSSGGTPNAATTRAAGERAWPAGGWTRRRDQVDDALAPPPADGEGGNIHVVELGQAAERPGAEHADTGGATEQGRGIEGHGEPGIGRGNGLSSPRSRGR